MCPPLAYSPPALHVSTLRDTDTGFIRREAVAWVLQELDVLAGDVTVNIPSAEGTQGGEGKGEGEGEGGGLLGVGGVEQ